MVCAKYTEDNNSTFGITDYRLYCFDEKTLYLYVSQGMEDRNIDSISILNTGYTLTDYGRTDYKPWQKLPKKPINFNKMVEITEKLSEGHPFLRVDLYEIRGTIYFGELTFSPCAGMMLFNPSEADYMVGQLIKLPNDE